MPNATLSARHVNAVQFAAGNGPEDRLGRTLPVRSIEYQFNADTNPPVRAAIYMPKRTQPPPPHAGTFARIDNDEYWGIHDIRKASTTP